ncbi:MAG: NPCBM/NEW2 domain-containing protein [Bacteroidales bacterium]|nr:NPCBM/NEW2 domain-containing protein [Candidatus Egerieousia equi]
MKKIILILLMLLGAFFELDAQINMAEVLKPVESNRYKAYSTKDTPVNVSSFNYAGGFTIASGRGGLISSGDAGFAVFKLGGAYSKMSFVLGPERPNSASDKYYVIVTIKADGRRILDQVVWCYDAPRYVTLDVTGVNELRIDLPKGEENLAFGCAKLWKSGQNVKVADNPLDKMPSGKIQLVEKLQPYFIRHSGWVNPIAKDWIGGAKNVQNISINRKTFNSGLQFTANEGFSDEKAWSYFWLGKRYDKISFILGPRDNQSSNASAWLVVKADKKIVYEGVVTQKDIARQVVVDVQGAEQVSFYSERRSSDFLGSITFGVVDMFAYRKGDSSVPSEGILNLNKDKIAALPDVCPLMSSIKPFSVRGISDAEQTMFTGESQYITFSMGGEHFCEGLLLTTGVNLMDTNKSSYFSFDLAGEFDWISFDVGCLTQRRVLDDDILRIYADDELVFERTIHCTWPNQHFEVPVNKCRNLRFEKPGTGKKKQNVIGVGDITLYRGKPVKNDLFVHERPECPYEADLIDLCERPYFHFVGRYLSSITNFDFNECFKNGSSQREYFQMKDGSKIYKGVMLETNIPFAFEDLGLLDVAFMFICGAGYSSSNSDVAAATGVSGGADITLGGISLLLMDPSKKQASAAAFNPYGEYESCTFTVANIYEYIDSFESTFGARTAPPVKLNVFADQRLVGEFWLDNKMQPTTYTVPIFKCHQLMFWLECGDSRSGQYILYDMKVSKAPCNIKIPESYTSGSAISQVGGSNSAASTAVSKSAVRKPAKKAGKRVAWDIDRSSGIGDVDKYLNSVSSIWKRTESLVKKVEAMSDSEFQRNFSSISQEANAIMSSIETARSFKADAALSLTRINSIMDIAYFGKFVKRGGKALDQCKADLEEMIQ